MVEKLEKDSFIAVGEPLTFHCFYFIFLMRDFVTNILFVD